MNTEASGRSTELEVTEAEFLPDHQLRVVASGQPAIITPNFEFLNRDIVVLKDDPTAEFPWVLNLAYHLDGDDTNFQARDKIVGGTGNPVMVCLAFRYKEALRQDSIKPGPLVVPTVKEAQNEIAAIWSRR